MVISIKIVRSGKEDGRIRQLLCLVFHKQDQVQGQRVRARRVISFGPTLHHATVQRIQELFDVPDGSFTGVGRDDGAVCNAPNIPVFQVGIPAAAVWSGVTPEHIIPHDGGNLYTLDLFSVVKTLRRCGELE
jgi:hypothetical protein